MTTGVRKKLHNILIAYETFQEQQPSSETTKNRIKKKNTLLENKKSTRNHVFFTYRF